MHDLIIQDIRYRTKRYRDHGSFGCFLVCDDTGVWRRIAVGKIDMLDFADVIALNKFDKRGALDALRDVKKGQYQRNHQLWDQGSGDAGFRDDRSAVQRSGNEPALPQADRQVERKLEAGFEKQVRDHRRDVEKIYIILRHEPVT